jgi:uncharacterized membrane protein
MTRLLATYAATFATMLIIDMLWLGVIARPLYQAGIGHLMADKPNLPVAGLFYLLYPIGLVVFAVLPQAANSGWAAAAGMAALFGFFAYATYDLTNLATLRDWPWTLAALDLAWGTAVSAAAATAGKLVFDRLS